MQAPKTQVLKRGDSFTGSAKITKKVLALPLYTHFILYMLLLYKLYEVRVDSKKTGGMRVGDELCFFAGKWVLYCNIWCVHRVKGVNALLNQFDWNALMPNETCEIDCKNRYTALGCTNTTKLVVWGVTPLDVKLRGYMKGDRIPCNGDVHVYTLARQILRKT